MSHSISRTWRWSMFISNWSLHCTFPQLYIMYSSVHSKIRSVKLYRAAQWYRVKYHSWLYMCTHYYYLFPPAMRLCLCSISAGQGQGRLSFTSQQPAGGDPSLGEDQRVRLDTRRMFWSNYLTSLSPGIVLTDSDCFLDMKMKSYE